MGKIRVKTLFLGLVKKPKTSIPRTSLKGNDFSHDFFHIFEIFHFFAVMKNLTNLIPMHTSGNIPEYPS